MAISAAEGSSEWYDYTGKVQSLTVPTDGIYKLEVYGAGGGYGGAKGGYSIGYKKLTKGVTLYIACGQMGGTQDGYGARFNGGQDSSSSQNQACWYGRRAGGGCTHIATKDGVLADLKDSKDAVLIVAGAGGSGKTAGDSSTTTGSGGQGGGLSGGSGTSGAGGTQSGGYAFGKGAPATVDECGGGAGWYGGYAGALGAGGGSSYIGGVPEFTYNGVTYTPSTTIGGGREWHTNGAARITLVKKTFLPVQVNGEQIEKILFNGTEITGLQFNGVTVF